MKRKIWISFSLSHNGRDSNHSDWAAAGAVVPRYPESSKNRRTDLLGFYSFLIHSTAKRWICYLVACLVKGLPFFLLLFGFTPRDLSVLDVSVSVDPSRSPHARRADGLLDLKKKKKTSRVLDICAHGWRRSICSKEKKKKQLFELISIVSGVTLHFRVWRGNKKTSFFILCCVAQQFERGTKWHTAGLRHNNLKLFSFFFFSLPHWISEK